ncbi:MAG: DUF1475 family protein [Candidatus Omnitrophica bacterium]|nr:DUF1475 family protein [Candidatus Omnitrophota bacterium]
MTNIKSSQINLLKWFFGLLSFGMVVLVVITCLQSDMFNLPDSVVNEPWFRTTLVDFYFNISIISAWAIYKEANALRSVLWVLSFILLGSIGTCFYVFLQLSQWRPGDSFGKVLLRDGEKS